MLFARYGVRRAGLTISGLTGARFLPCLNTRAVHGLHMSGARTMTVFATNGHFGKGCVFELSIGPGHRVRPATVAEDAAGHDRAVEAKIGELIPGRGSPTHRPGIERKRRLKEIPVFLDDPTQSIRSSPDDPFDRVGGPEALLPVGAGSRFALIELSLQRIDLKVPVESFIEVRGREMSVFQKGRRHQRHRTSHAGLRKSSRDVRMASRASLGADIPVPGLAALSGGLSWGIGSFFASPALDAQQEQWAGKQERHQ